MRVSRFTGLVIPAKFIVARARAWSGRGWDIHVKRLSMLRERRRNDVLPPFAIIYSDAFTCLASGAESRSGRSVSGRTDTRAREAVKQNETYS